MRHLKANKKLGMDSSHRKAVLRNMVTSLIEHERIKTTDTRAKELRRIADRMVTLGKRGDLHALRQTMEVIRVKSVATKLFEDIAPRYKDINGGYTRIIKIGHRHGDNAPLSIIEFTVQKQEEKKEPKKETKKAPKKESKKEPKKEPKKEAKKEPKKEPKKSVVKKTKAASEEKA
jgi:large subunit ribosomal protein L17